MRMKRGPVRFIIARGAVRSHNKIKDPIRSGRSAIGGM